MSDRTDQFDLATLTAPDGFWRHAHCSPVLCAGHADESTPHDHSTDLNGLLGEHLAITQIDGQPPLVSVLPPSTAQWDFTPAGAREHALQLLIAADLADRFTLPVPAADIIPALTAALVAAAG